MKLLHALPALALLLCHAHAAGPLRILYLGAEGTARHCAALMQELGREAIWFEFASVAAPVTEERCGKFDLVMIDAPAWPEPPGMRVVKATFGHDEKSWIEPGFIEATRESVLAALTPERRADWEKFLAQREPEQREPNPFVANYEKRPEPIGFQHPMSVRGSMERTQVPADMHLELFAAEPQITKPIAMAWDERGRLWIAESRDYPHGLVPSGEGNDDIKICEDTDGDGKADKFTVFADKLNLPTSLTFARGGLIVGQAPRFLFLKDTDGDDRADVREVIMESWGVRDTHAQANNLHYGYDNWLHGCVGYSGFEGMVGGTMQKFTMGTYRFKADGSKVEFLHQFTNNSWGQSQNAAGDDFGSTANNAPLFYGGIPASIWPPGKQVMSAKRINVEDKVHAITPNYRQVDVFGGYTAAAGSAFIYSKNLPPRLQGQAMVCEPTMKVITLQDVQPEGAGYVAKDGFNLVASSDEWMSPVCAEVGPDGSVWFADWENFIIQHNPTPSPERGGFVAKTGVGGAHENPLRDHERGRIYRVAWDQATKPALISLQGASAGELVAALGNDTQFWRLTAQRLLVEGHRVEAVEALKKLAAGPDGVAAVHALWTLHGLGMLDDATLKTTLSAKDAPVRRTAIRTLPPDARGEAMLLGSSALQDGDLHTRLAALVKLGELPTTPAVQHAVRMVANTPEVQADEWLREAAKLLGNKHGTDAHHEGPNLLPNPGFETTGAGGLPEGWKRVELNDLSPSRNAEWKVVKEETLRRSGAAAVRCITRGPGETSLVAQVTLKPNTPYRLAGWVKTHAFKGNELLKELAGGHETERLTAGDSEWTELETVFDSGEKTTTSIALVHLGKGDAHFDDVSLAEVLPPAAEEIPSGDSARGEQVFFKHPTVSCVLCHRLRGQGSTVGPALDGIATRAQPAYIAESLLEPNKVLAKGYEALGASPMPPMGLILTAQELADVQAFLQTLK